MTGRSLKPRWSRSPFPNDETTLRIDSHEEQVGSLVRISSRLPDLFHHAPLQIWGPQERVKIIIKKTNFIFFCHLTNSMNSMKDNLKPLHQQLSTNCPIIGLQNRVLIVFSYESWIKRSIYKQQNVTIVIILFVPCCDLPPAKFDDGY